ncbi:hypothetical protein DXA25_03885 [Ruminococcus bromii]|nr:hypothetical protein DXA25_03885 [Ruminococcus bromii]
MHPCSVVITVKSVKNKADCVSLKNAGEHSPLCRFCKDITMMLRIFEQKNKTAVSPRPFPSHKILINRLKESDCTQYNLNFPKCHPSHKHQGTTAL